jgi:hypothetical protein
LPAKLSKGGGDEVTHSSVVASQGLSAAFLPLKMLQKKLKMKMNYAETVMIAAQVTKWMSG